MRLLTLLYAAAKNETITTIYDGIELETMSMRSYKFG